MTSRARLALATLLAVSLFGIIVGNASANRLSINETRFRIVWNRLTFNEETAEARDVCPVTMEGSFHSGTIRKVLGALIGHVTRAAAGACTGGGLTILRETLPWHVTYEGFFGTLPRITGLLILLRNIAWQERIVSPLGEMTCLIRLVRALFIVPVIAETGQLESVEAEQRERFSCGLLTEHLSGTGTITRQESAERIVIRLI